MTSPEFGPHLSEFSRLEYAVSDELLQGAGVFTLFSYALAEHGFTSDRPGLIVRPFYDPILPPQIDSLGLHKTETVPMSLQIAIPKLSTWGGDPYPSTDFIYVKLGVMTNDELQSFVYNDSGLLRERLDVANGSDLEKSRVQAVSSWKKAHHAMLNASRFNPAIRLDLTHGTWTDLPPDNYIDFDLE